MSSRLKERGGSGGKIMASKPSKILPCGSLKEKPGSLKISVVPSGKELSRPLSACRSSVTRMNQALPAASLKECPRPISAGRPSIARSSAATSGKENPRPVSAGRPSNVRTVNASLRQAEKITSSSVAPAPAPARWSTALLPKGKFTDLRSDLLPRASNSRERRSFTGFSSADKNLAMNGQLVKNSNGNGEKSLKAIEDVLVGNNSIGSLSAKVMKNAYKVLDAKPNKATAIAPVVEAIPLASQNSFPRNVSGSNIKSLRQRVLGNSADGVSLIKSKQFEENGNVKVTEVSDLETVNQTLDLSTIDVKPFNSSKVIKTLDLVSKASCEAEVGLCYDNASNHMVSDCLSLNDSINGDSSSELGNGKADSKNIFFLDEHQREEAAAPLGLESVRTDRHVVVEVKDACSDHKYQSSSLQEKLALLEGKVQKIALEIKQTKEMLHKNKSSQSKFAISDIQKKVYGVEIAVNDLKDGVKSEFDSTAEGKICSMQQDCHAASSMSSLTENSSASIKGSNFEALEKKFFPHHNLVTALHAKDPKSIIYDVNEELNRGVVSKMQLDSSSSVHCGSASMVGGPHEEVALESDEKLEEFDILENNPPLIECFGCEESSIDQVYDIGRKISTGGWFVSEEAVLLAHDDNSCSYYDITNNEVKSVYKPPAGLSNNLWGDCWLIRAPGPDGCSGQYILAASAGNALESGFCSWDFYTKDIKAFHAVGEKKSNPSGSLARGALQASSFLESQSCWYRPCGPLLISTASRQRAVNAYDIRDGDLVMTWEVHSPVSEMEYSSPLQWRSRGKTVIAERDAITLWDVNSLNPQPVLSVPCMGKKIYSLHVNNTDAEIGAGVRQRASSTEVEGNDGVFCTQDSVSVLDFRVPSGAGIKICRRGANALSIFSLKDSIFIGSTEGRLSVRSSPRSQVEHFSLRKGKAVATYVMPEFNSHYHHSSITQVWGNSNLVMGICGMGMFVFDAFKDEAITSSNLFKGSTAQPKEAIGPDDLYRPTFDYIESRTLIISRDRPAFWRYLY